MVYDFSTRLDRLGTRMKTINDNSLIYTRPGEVAIEIENFTPQKCDVNELAMYGIPLVLDKLQDFCFDTADLSSLTYPLPKQGDQIEWNGKTFETFLIGDQVFRFTTSTRVRIRIHGRQTG